MALSYLELRDGVAGDAVGIRVRNVLEPLGGAGDKIFPPTYSVADGVATQYAMEKRQIPAVDGGGASTVDSVVLDSVASQANRFELALLDCVRRGNLSVPVTSVDFSQVPELEWLDRISDFEAPHRIFDALLRDSYDGDLLFRFGKTGMAITEARPRNAAGLYHHSPHTLVFGGWDSTGPRGGLGAKYERAITSEVVAVDVQRGVKTASRIDPTGIQSQAGPLYEATDGTWTLDEALAAKDSKNIPKRLGSGSQAGRPSLANLGNVAPSIEERAGGVTAREIVSTTVLSLIQLRRLRFPVGADGQSVARDQLAKTELAAHTALAALGLAAAALAFEQGFDLRSRCVLVTSAPGRFEAVSRNGRVTQFDLTSADALDLVTEAAEHASAVGMPWRACELLLRPSDRLAQLIRKSNGIVQSETAGH